MSGKTYCASCGEPIADAGVKTPCVKCGSTLRNYCLTVEPGHFSFKGSDVILNVVRYPVILLQTAKRLFDGGEFAVAVVVAHTACEVAVERVISQSLAQSNIPQIADCVDKLLNGYNLSNPKVRSLFDALTGKRIAVDKENIWKQFCNSVTRRNRAVHAGEQPTRDEAEESLAVAGEMVQYLVALIQ